MSAEARMSAAMAVGEQRARRSKWTEARAAYESATAIGSRDLMSAEDLKKFALILLMAADAESFRETASYMVERFKDSKEESELTETIRMNCLLRDQFERKDPLDLEVLREMESRIAVTRVEEALAVGIAGYRRDDGSTGWLGSSAGADEKRQGAGDIYGLRAPAAHAVLACIMAKAGDQRLARDLFERAEASTHPDMLNRNDMGEWWDAVVQNRLFIAEAREELAKMTPKAELVARGSTWSYFAPTDGIDPASTDPEFHATFFLPEFDDRRWKTGIDAGNGLGYGDPVDVEWPTPPEGKRYSAYLRHRFMLEEPMTRLTFCTQYDDGFICYLDGVRLAHSSNMENSNEGFEVMATGTILSEREKTPALREISDPALLEPGEHVVAISLHSADQNSSDLRIADIRLLGTPQSELERIVSPDLLPAVAARSDFDLMNQHALEEDWDTAKKHAVAIRLGTDFYPEDPSSTDVKAHGIALLKCGERKEYQRHCILMLGEFRHSDDARSLNVTAKTILVTPKAKDSPLCAEAIEFARRSVEIGPGGTTC